MRRLPSTLACLCLALVTAACGASSERYERTHVAMGTPIRVVLYAHDGDAAHAAARAAFDRIDALDAALSDYREDSELRRLCAEAGGPAVAVSADLFEVLDLAREIGDASQGAFDVTVGPCVRLWRAARGSGSLPPAAALREARARVGWRHVTLDGDRRSVRLTQPGMQLDLGGIGKGYAAQAAYDVLAARGFRQALVDVGGDIVVGAAPPGRRGWTVLAGAEGSPLEVANRAVAASGDTERYVEVDGIRYSHIVDPRTGVGLTHRARVTVIAPTGAVADALASAVSVLDTARGLVLIEGQPDTEASIERVGPGGVERHRTSGWPTENARP